MTEKEVNERFNVILACFLCGALTGLLVFIVTHLSIDIYSWTPWMCFLAGIGNVLIGILVTLIVVAAMFGREWFGD